MNVQLDTIDTSINTRHCYGCDRDLIIDEFHLRTRNGKLDHSEQCKQCKSQYDKLYNEKNKERAKITRAKYYQEHSDKIRSYARAYSKLHRKERAAYAKKHYQENIDVMRAKGREWYKNNPLSTKKSSLKKHFNITLEQFNNILLVQDYKCCICQTVFEKSKDTHLDHDHNCCPTQNSCGKCIRGALCGHCNKGLGLFRENADNLLRAYKYLKGKIK